MACANARASGGADPLTTRGGTRLCMLDDDIIHHILERLSDGALVVALTCTHLRDAVHQHSGTHRIESNASHVCVCSPAQHPPQRGLCVCHKHRVPYASLSLSLRPPSPRRRSPPRRVGLALVTGSVPSSIYEAEPPHGHK